MLCELEYRLYTESVALKTPVLKQILNGDEFLNVHMILRINDIHYDGVLRNYILQLSDGWYTIFAIVMAKHTIVKNNYYQSNHSLLLNLLDQKKITVG